MDDVVIVDRVFGADRFLAVLNFGAERTRLRGLLPEGRWRVLADSTATQFRGPDPAAPTEIVGGMQVEVDVAPMSARWLAAP